MKIIYKPAHVKMVLIISAKNEGSGEHALSLVRAFAVCSDDIGNQNLSHLSAHMVNRLLHKNWKSIPKCLSGKKTFQNCNPPDFIPAS